MHSMINLNSLGHGVARASCGPNKIFTGGKQKQRCRCCPALPCPAPVRPVFDAMPANAALDLRRVSLKEEQHKGLAAGPPHIQCKSAKKLTNFYICTTKTYTTCVCWATH